MNTLTNLALNNNKNNRIRSILIIISVFLSSLLLTTISLYVTGLIRYNKENAKFMYGSFYGIYKNVTPKQEENLKLHSEFDEIGKVSRAGYVLSDKTVTLRWADEVGIELTNMSAQLESGNFPTKENEITASKAFFQLYEIPNPKIGDSVVINWRPNLEQEYQKITLQISGFLKENPIEELFEEFTAFVSEKFFNKIPIENQRYNIYFSLHDSIDITSENAETVLTELANVCKIDKQMVDVNKNYLYWLLNIDIESIAACGIIALIVIIFSVSILYNIFQVGIVQKIQEYGKLKALGATKKQMKQIILREGMLLAIIGIPLGLLGGYLLTKSSFGFLINQANIAKENSILQLKMVPIFSFWMLMLSAFLSIVTVYLSLKRPMKIVSQISPIEAIRFQENRKKKNGWRKGKITMGVLDFTIANLSANKKRTISTICTMGLSCVLFVTLASFIGNMKEEYEARKEIEYGQFQLELNYSVEDTAYPENNLDYILKKNPINTELLEKIKVLDGVTGVQTRNLLAAKELDKNGNEIEKLMSILVLNEEDFNTEKLYGAEIGELNYYNASKDIIYFGWSSALDSTEYQIGQTLSLYLFDGKNKVKFHPVLAGSFGSIEADWVITEEIYQNLGLNKACFGTLWVDCKPKDVEKVEYQLKQLIGQVEHVELSSFQDALKLGKLSISMMKLLTYGFLAIIGLISFMNLANTMIISIITRKQEFGILQAVGMTNHQLNISLQLEGFLFSFGTILIAFLIGTPLGYVLFSYGKSKQFYGLNVYHFPFVEMCMIILLVGGLQLILSFLLSRNLKKESIIERIRYQG